MLTELNQCPICRAQTKVYQDPDRLIYRVNCPRCSKYELTDEAFTMYDKSEEHTKILSVSFWIRQHQKEKGNIEVDLITMRRLLVPFIPLKPREQADSFILWMGRAIHKPNQTAKCSSNNLLSIIGAYDELGVFYIAKHLLDEDLIYEHEVKLGIVPQEYNLQLTFKGWDRYYELQHSNKDSRLVFMAMQYDNQTPHKIFRDIIIPSVRDAGFEIRKLDDVKRAGLIDDKLRVETRRSKFIIADLTDENRGAYWEAGFAEGLGMPVIYICEEEKFDKDKPHFDTNHHLTVLWKDCKEGLIKFADELKATIRETFPAEAKTED